LAGIYGGLEPESGRLLLSADGIRASGTDLALVVPPEIDTTNLEVGDSFLATAMLEEGGALTLAGLVGDEGTRGADDPDSAQGDLRR
jgi:hypothetical protein